MYAILIGNVLYIYTHMCVHICEDHPICEPFLDKANFEDKDSKPEPANIHHFMIKLSQTWKKSSILLLDEMILSPHHPPVIKRGNDHSKGMEVYGWDHRPFHFPWIFHVGDLTSG